MELRSGEPLWAIRSGLLRTYPPVRRDQSAEVVVLGAGITGALVARALAVEGADVLVVDRHDVGMGSSAASTGLLQYSTDSSLTDLISRVGEKPAVDVFRMGRKAIDTIEKLSLELGDSCGFARRPSLYLASREGSIPTLTREYHAQKRHGFDVALLNRTDIEACYSFGAATGLYCQGDAEIDCYRFVHALMADAEKRGARVCDRTDIVSVTTGRRGVVLETERGHKIFAGSLISAAGYQTEDELFRTPAELSTTWAFASEPVDAFTGWDDRCLIWETSRPYFYLRTTDDGRVVAGGRDVGSPSRHENPQQLRRQTDALAKRVQGMFPDIAIDVSYRWAGVFAATADSLPLIGTLPQFPNTWFTLGYGGNGITFSVIAADIIRHAYFGSRHPAADLFGFDRPSLGSYRIRRPG